MLASSELQRTHGHRDSADFEAFFRGDLRRFLKTLDGYAIDREHRLPSHILEQAADLGLFGLTIPAPYGGAGASLGTACRVVDAIATVDRALAITVGLHAGLGTRSLVELGDPEWRSDWLPGMARGTIIGAFAATESGAGSDLTHIRTTLREVVGGFELDGEKSYVTNGGFAGLFTVLARMPTSDGARSHALVLVPRVSSGVHVGAEEDKLGIRGSSTVTVRFENVFVQASQVMGERGRGMDDAHAALTWGRTIMAAGCVGTARAALDAAVAHVTSRRQFGRPIGTFAAVRQQTVDMAARVLAMDALVRRVAAHHAAGRNIDAAALAAKVFCSEGAFAVCDRAVQLHGAMGYLEPIGVARMLRDCRVTRIFEGANDVLLIRAGAARVTSRVPVARSVAEDVGTKGATDPLASRCRDLAAQIDAATCAIRDAHGVRFISEQLALQRVAQAAIALEAALATLPLATGPDGALAAYAVHETVDEGERHLDALAKDRHKGALAAALTDHVYARGAS